MSVKNLIHRISADAHLVDQAMLERWLSDVLDRIRSESDRTKMLSRLEVLEQRPAVIVERGPELEDPVMTCEDVMRELSVSHNYLNDLRHVGVLVGFRLGKERQYRRSEVEVFLQKRQTSIGRIRIEAKLRELRINRQENRERKEARLRA